MGGGGGEGSLSDREGWGEGPGWQGLLADAPSLAGVGVGVGEPPIATCTRGYRSKGDCWVGGVWKSASSAISREN